MRRIIPEHSESVNSPNGLSASAGCSAASINSLALAGLAGAPNGSGRRRMRLEPAWRRWRLVVALVARCAAGGAGWRLGRGCRCTCAVHLDLDSTML